MNSFSMFFRMELTASAVGKMRSFLIYKQQFLISSFLLVSFITVSYFQFISFQGFQTLKVHCESQGCHKGIFYLIYGSRMDDVLYIRLNEVNISYTESVCQFKGGFSMQVFR